MVRGLFGFLDDIRQIKECEGCSLDEAWRLWEESNKPEPPSNVIHVDFLRPTVAER
jgi:hypothetical protein